MLPTKESKGRMLGRYSVRLQPSPFLPWESTQSNKNELKLPLTRWSLVRWGFCIHAGVGFVCLCVCKCTKGNFHYALNYTPLVVMEFEIIPPLNPLCGAREGGWWQLFTPGFIAHLPMVRYSGCELCPASQCSKREIRLSFGLDNDDRRVFCLVGW